MQTHTTLGLALHRVGQCPDRCEVTHREMRQPDDTGMLVLLDAGLTGTSRFEMSDKLESWLEKVMAELDGAAARLTN